MTITEAKIYWPFNQKKIPYWMYNLANKLGFDTWTNFDRQIWFTKKIKTNGQNNRNNADYSI